MLQPIETSTFTDGNNYAPEQIEAMQRTVINIFERWGLSDGDAVVLLGGISTKTFGRWKAREYGRVDRDLADRMSLILGIHKALRIVFTQPARGYAWIKAANEALDSQSALDVMKKGGMSDLIRIRRYLDSVRGGW